ncbi:MAG TPA: peroxiredoxin [Caulobacteraceae bacterium]|nr:peroxiredoxin [Caulobacteraceae bacterium]
MKKTLLAFAALAAFAATTPAVAALAVGARAPDFTAPAAMGGKSFSFTLDAALKKGPVVLYFFPAAFTTGCTIEAHDFADATDGYKKLGATVIGVTAGNIDRLAEFSTSECRSKFPVAADADLSIAKEYDSTMAEFPGHSNRTSYVIAPDHKIVFIYSNPDPSRHVDLTMDAVKTWRAGHPN